MTHRMVLAALGAPDSKLREQVDGDPNGARYEEWIYGHVPQTVRFVRFVGDRVTMVEIAEMGKPIQVHDKDEMAGYEDPSLTHEVAVGDRQARNDGDGAAPKPPTLHQAGDPEDAPNAQGKVQFPDDPDAKSTSSKSTTTKPAATDSQPDNSTPADSTTAPRSKPSLGSDPSSQLL